MLVDMHLHECTYSTDSFLHLEEIAENAINKSNKGKSLVTLIFLSQSEVKKP